MVERQIVDLVVEGSSPFFHPKVQHQTCWTFSLAPVAQLDRASDFESAGRTFESCQTQRPRFANLGLFCFKSFITRLFQTEYSLCGLLRRRVHRRHGQALEFQQAPKAALHTAGHAFFQLLPSRQHTAL